MLCIMRFTSYLICFLFHTKLELNWNKVGSAAGVARGWGYIQGVNRGAARFGVEVGFEHSNLLKKVV